MYHFAQLKMTSARVLIGSAIQILAMIISGVMGLILTKKNLHRCDGNGLLCMQKALVPVVDKIFWNVYRKRTTL